MPIDTITRLPTEALELLQFWKDARGPHVLPNVRHLNPIKLRRWIGNISKIEVRKGEKRIFVRLHGTETSEYVGKNFTGKYLEDCTPPHALPLALEPYDVSISSLAPVFSVLLPDVASGVFSTFERVVLPFTNVDENDEISPVTVDWFIAWVAPTQIDSLNRVMVYGDSPPSPAEHKRALDAMEMMVIDVDDPTYNLFAECHTIAQSAAALPSAKQACSK